MTSQTQTLESKDNMDDMKKPNRKALPNPLTAILDLTSKGLERNVSKLSLKDLVKLQTKQKEIEQLLSDKLKTYNSINESAESFIAKLKKEGFSEKDISQVMEEKLK